MRPQAMRGLAAAPAGANIQYYLARENGAEMAIRFMADWAKDRSKWLPGA